VDLLIDRGRLTKYQGNVITNRRTGWLKIGDYIIQDMLGKGGMGVVYKALDTRMHREVAIKMLLESGQQSDDKIERFRREAIAAARMNHPNIVTAYTANEHEGYPYLVMEYVKGRDLGSLVKKGDKLPVGEAVNYILQACVGMAYAHSRHIIHRDLKPSNLLLATPDDSDIRPGQYSRVKILDMGLARLTQPQGEVVSPALEGSDLSATGMLMGTVDYMAPEQAMDTKRADHRSDIYSLGCTLYYLLTKRPVYTGSNLLERISAHLKADIPSLKEARPDSPEELDTVFQKMVAKKPKDRYQSMTEVVEAQFLAVHLARRNPDGRQRLCPAWLLIRVQVRVGSGITRLGSHDCLRLRSGARHRGIVLWQHGACGGISL
jgi:serine/threonine protein kinase